MNARDFSGRRGEEAKNNSHRRANEGASGQRIVHKAAANPSGMQPREISCRRSRRSSGNRFLNLLRYRRLPRLRLRSALGLRDDPVDFADHGNRGHVGARNRYKEKCRRNIASDRAGRHFLGAQRVAATGALTDVSQPWRSGLAPLVSAKNSSWSLRVMGPATPLPTWM